MPASDPYFIDKTTVAVEKTVRDSLKRKKQEFGFTRTSDAVLELIRYHDVIPVYVDNRVKLNVLFKSLPEETEFVLTEFENTSWQFEDLDFVARINEIRENDQ